MIETPRGNRVHISLFGKTNAGKSSIINAITNQSISLVSDERGTTTDPVYKSMELLPIGPVVFIDTAGIDDNSTLGSLRIKKTKEIVNKTDIALLVVSNEDVEKIYKKLSPCLKKLSPDNDDFLTQTVDNFKIRDIFSEELKWLQLINTRSIKILGVVNKIDLIVDNFKLNLTLDILERLFNLKFVSVSAENKQNIDLLKNAIIRLAPKDLNNPVLVGDLIKKGDYVLLVAPQDIQAPKGRLILPQVQVLRDILDYKGIPIMTTLDNLDNSLKLLNNKPDLVITDSQVFNIVNSKVDKNIPLTSFSILMARQKGDIKSLYNGAKKIRNLKSGDKVLIAEACTHHQLKGDIAREKLPTWLEEICPGIIIENCSGKDFPSNLENFSLVIHCGACMFNRAELMSRINISLDKNVSITNFGLAIAEINNILDRVTAPLSDFR